MKRQTMIIPFSIVCLFFLVGCPRIAQIPTVPEVPRVVPLAGPLAHIIVSPADPRTTVGGTVILTATGKDAEGRDVDINPTWKCGPEGEVTPTVGKTVTFRALKSGVCYIEVRHGDVSTTVAVEIEY